MNKRATENNLNREQFEQLKERYVQTYVDSMSSKDLYEYVANDMYNYVDKMTYNEVIYEINSYLDEKTCQEFISQIKEQLSWLKEQLNLT